MGSRGRKEGEGRGGPRLLRTGMLAEHDNNIIPKLFLVYCLFPLSSFRRSPRSLPEAGRSNVSPSKKKLKKN